MYNTASVIVFALGLALCVAAFAYALAAIVAVRRFRKRLDAPRAAHTGAPATIIKPICGADREHYENLRSFCEQDYPAFQVIFAVRSAGDPAIPAIRRIIAELPERDISLVVDPAVHGANLKVSNLINAYPRAKHDILVISDADMRVGRDYLAAVMAAFADPRVGAATCLYRGVPMGGTASRLATLYINDWFLPSVLVAEMLQEVRFCFGATMAIRRGILDGAGGFRSLAGVLADDYMIGEYAARAGYRVAICPYVVDNMLHEPALGDVLRREHRWSHTIRALRPSGHFFSVTMNTISVAIAAGTIAGLAAGAPLVALGLVATAVALRVGLHHAVCRTLGIGRPGPLWLVPIRDIVSTAMWLSGYFGHTVRWRGENLAVRQGGTITLKSLELR
jgi:ceramide glucosyltransferase